MTSKSKLSAKQKEEIKRLFKYFDKDGNGSISIKELGLAVRAMGTNPTEAEIRDMVKQADKDGSGHVEFHEFMQLMESKYKDKDQEKRELEEAFKVFDKNCDGYLDVNELMVAVTSLGDRLTKSEVEGLIRDVDVNGDGLVSYHEFIKLMCPDA